MFSVGCGTRRQILALAALVALPVPVPAVGNTLRFGILPLGGALESRTDWEPLLADCEKALRVRVKVFSATSYDSLEQALQRGEIDMALLSGRLALDAVTLHGMRVVAQVVRHDGLPGYRALLLLRKQGDPTTLSAVFEQPERWRLAHGEKASMSGFIVPQLQLFLPRGVLMETRFRAGQTVTHQAAALAVANGEADIATNNSADFERFKSQFPAEAERLQVVWESGLIPHAQIVLRDAYDAAFQTRVREFLAGYGRSKGAAGDAERAALRTLHNLAGFLPADNRTLLPAAKLAYQLAQQNAVTAQWVSSQARQQRLDRLQQLYQQQMDVLEKTP